MSEHQWEFRRVNNGSVAGRTEFYLSGLGEDDPDFTPGNSPRLSLEHREFQPFWEKLVDAELVADRLNDTGSRERINELESQVADLENDLQRQQDKYDKLYSDLEEKRAEFATAQSIIRRLEEDLADANSTIRQHERDREFYEKWRADIVRESIKLKKLKEDFCPQPVARTIHVVCREELLESEMCIDGRRKVTWM